MIVLLILNQDDLFICKIHRALSKRLNLYCSSAAPGAFLIADWMLIEDMTILHLVCFDMGFRYWTVDSARVGWKDCFGMLGRVSSCV